jgi:hypothetical protein
LYGQEKDGAGKGLIFCRSWLAGDQNDAIHQFDRIAGKPAPAG